MALRPVKKHRQLMTTMLYSGKPVIVFAGACDDEIRYHRLVALLARGQAVTAELSIPLNRTELRAKIP